MVCTHCILLIQSSVDGHLGCFCCLSIVNNAATNIHTQVFVLTYVFISFGQIPTTELLGNFYVYIYRF